MIKLGLLFSLLYLCVAEDPVVQLPNGKILGRQDVTSEGNNIYIFQKVPYAAPPLGQLRFQPPQAHENWENVLETTHLDITCFQTSYSETPVENEDCLYLNVFTPKLPSDENNVLLPVMFYIHGGGFVEGSSDWFTGDRFVDQNVVFVSINYRVGPLGFLSTEDDVIPGNNGLKDQQFALRWVYENIALFGGDPKQITIFGESAGSASVAYQLLNQNNKDLIAGAILQSGSFLSPWAFERRAKEIAFATAAFINSTFQTNRNSRDLLDFLLSVEASAIDKASEQYRDSVNAGNPQWLEIITGFQWAPVIEVKNPSAFLTKKMYKLLEAGSVVPVPIIIGINSEEGLAFWADASNLEYNLQQYDVHLEWLVPNDMSIEDEDEKKSVGEKIRSIYTNGKSLAGNDGAGIRYTSDTSFTRSVIKTAELFSKAAKTYFYEFTYHGTLPGRNTLYDGAETVSHGEELSYMFCSGQNCKITGFPEADQVTSQRFLKLWTDFAKYQNPTPEATELLQNITWPAVSTDSGDLLYLDIGENLEIKNHPKEESYAAWIELYNNLDYDDFDTY